MSAGAQDGDRAGGGLLWGFGNAHATEALTGALPTGRNSPQKPPGGLFAEQISGTAFTAPRHENRRSWLYRRRPSAEHPPFAPHPSGLIRSGPFNESPATPNRLRWDPLEAEAPGQDFVEGLVTICGSGDPGAMEGIAVHVYIADRSMERRAFASADGELLIVPQDGALSLRTEFGLLSIAPGQIALVPRGVRFSVGLCGPHARGYVCENYGAAFRLPELGPIGSNGLANARDFCAPCAAVEDEESPYEVVQKFQGALWSMTQNRSPFDVVAWHGNLCPYTYDLSRFNVIGSISYDHPDPSIFTVLSSPSAVPGTANCDFVIFPPRWLVAEDTFRPPWFHRNVMSEFMGLVRGAYDAKAGGFTPGGMSLHPAMSAHGPDLASWRTASDVVLAPQKLDATLAFMFESRLVLRPTAWAMGTPALQSAYDACWDGFTAAAAARV